MRVALCQSILPAYRVPIFRRLAALPGVGLTVVISDKMGGFDGGGENLGFDLLRVPERKIAFFAGRLFHRPDFREIIASGQYDLVILPWNVRYVNLASALRLGRRRGVPVILWGHGCSKHPHSYAEWYRNRLGRQAAGVLLYTHRVAEALVRRAGFDPARVFVAQNALDQTPIREACQAWHADPAALAKFQRDQQVVPSNTLIFVSRLLKEKRPEMLLHGLRLLRQRRPEARLMIVGDGPGLGALRALAARLNLEAHVRFTGAIYQEARLAPWMLSAALCAYPVDMGLSLMHAFGYGLPVVTSDALLHQGPEIEALSPGVNGFLYRDGDVEDMVHRWASILSDPGLQQRMSRAAEQTVRENYSAEHMMEGFVAALRLAGYREQPAPAVIPDAAAAAHRRPGLDAPSLK